MTKYYWLSIGVSQAIFLAEIFVAHSSMPDGIKAALTTFIAGGQELIVALSAGV